MQFFEEHLYIYYPFSIDQYSSLTTLDKHFLYEYKIEDGLSKQHLLYSCDIRDWKLSKDIDQAPRHHHQQGLQYYQLHSD